MPIIYKIFIDLGWEKCENRPQKNGRKDPTMELKKKFVINAAFYGILLAIIICTYQYIVPILMPFIVGFVVATVVQFPLNRIKTKNHTQRKMVSSALCVAFYSIVISLLIWLGYVVVSEVGTFIYYLPTLFTEDLYPVFIYCADRLQGILAPIDPALAQWIIEMGRDVAGSLAQFATDISAGAVKIVASGAVSIPSVLVTIIITIVSTFFISADYRLVLDFLKSLIPESKRHYVIHILRYAETAVLVYIKSYSILFCLTFVELWLGLSILNIPYAFAIGLGIAVFDLMPILGTGGVLLPWSVILLAMGNIPLGIGIALLYIIITAVRNSLEPRIVGDQIGMHPLATMVAMILGLKLMGIVGMMLFPITLVAVTNLRKTAKEESQSK